MVLFRFLILLLAFTFSSTASVAQARAQRKPTRTPIPTAQVYTPTRTPTFTATPRLAVSIVSPDQNITFYTAHTVLISALPKGITGITKVEFCEGATCWPQTTIHGCYGGTCYWYYWFVNAGLNGTHSWVVNVYDMLGHITASDTRIITIAIDATPPSIPAGINAISESNCNQISLAWIASIDSGGTTQASGLRGYNVYQNGLFIQQVTTPSLSDANLFGSTLYSYTISAVDNSGNESAQSIGVSATTASCTDITPPSMPDNMSAHIASCTQVDLSWAPVTDTGGSGLKGYYLDRDGTLMAYLPAPTTQVSDTELAASTIHDYTISAVDYAGNVSEKTTRISLNTPACTNANDIWSTYGHDGRRTFASKGSIPGELVALWRYRPTSSSPCVISRAIADTNAVFLRWQDCATNTIGMDAVSPQGTEIWSRPWLTGNIPLSRSQWPAMVSGNVVINEDAIYTIDSATGYGIRNTGIPDTWGNVLADPTAARFYTVNDLHLDGPGLFLRALDMSLATLWTANFFEPNYWSSSSDDLGGALAINDNTLFYAPKYKPYFAEPFPLVPGLYALNGSNGVRKWLFATTPMSAPSIGNGRVYLVEKTKLIAHDEKTGAVLWAQNVIGIGGQAPVLANGSVIIATQSDVRAFDAATGLNLWITPIAGATYTADRWTTTLAAALGSDTLIVTASDGIHILSLITGKELWQGVPSVAVGRMRDPIIVGNRVYVVDGSTYNDGGLIGLE